MEIKVTRNMLKNQPVLKIGYCQAQHLFSGLQRVGYTCGVYGWNADVYDIDGVYVLTGYRFNGISGKYADFDALRRIEAEAEAVNKRYWNDASFGYGEKAAALEALRAELIRISFNK